MFLTWDLLRAGTSLRVVFSIIFPLSVHSHYPSWITLRRKIRGISEFSGIVHLLRFVTPNRDSRLLTREVYLAAGKPYYKLHKCFDAVTSFGFSNMPPKRSHCNRLASKLATLQWVFSKTKNLSLFQQINHLTTSLETMLEHRKNNQELLALDHSNPKATLARWLKPRTTPVRSSATQVQYIIHNDVYVNNALDIAQTFGDFFPSTPMNDDNPATPCRSRLTA